MDLTNIRPADAPLSSVAHTGIICQNEAIFKDIVSVE
jgi:hypothetical protein